MKNLKKLIAILASASMIMSLGATAFAEEEAPKPGLDTTAGTITFVVNDVNLTASETDDYITLLAYSVPANTAAPVDYDAEAGHQIIALDQTTGLDGFPTISFDTDKLIEGSEKVMVKVGGTLKTEPIEWLLGVTSTPEGPVITFVNGAVSTTPVQLSNGNYEAVLEWNGGTPINNKTFTLYSFVDENGNEYLVENGEVDLSAIDEDTTLYAKYNTGIIVGDVNFSGAVDGADANQIFRRIYNNATNGAAKYVGSGIYENSTVLIGDVNSSGAVDGADTNQIFRRIYNNATNGAAKYVGLTIYLTNSNDGVTSTLAQAPVVE